MRKDWRNRPPLNSNRKVQKADVAPSAKDGAPVSNRERWMILGICVLITLSVWAVFGQTLRHEFVNFDDSVYVTEKRHVLSGLNWEGLRWAFTNLKAGFWHPLTWLSLMLDAQFYGLWAGGYHLSNVLWHTGNSLLLFLLLRRLTGALWRSAMVAALFAVHPLHVESVAWVSARKDLLSTTFGRLTLLCYARYVETKVRNPATALPNYALALVFFACGLMSKTMVVTFPVVMLLLDYWPLRRLEISFRHFPFGPVRRLVVEKLPFIGLAVVGGVLTVYAEKNVGALPDTAACPMRIRLPNAALSSVRYLERTVWPTDLAVVYPYPQSFSTALVSASVLLLILISLVVIGLTRRFPYMAVGWFWYVITLSPVSGLIQVGGHASADRYTYVPLIGIFLMAVWGLSELGSIWRRGVVVLRIAGTTVLVLLMIVAARQTWHWRNSEILWTHTLTCTSQNSVAHNNLGLFLYKAGRLDEALAHFTAQVMIVPKDPEAQFNLGEVLSDLSRLDEAIVHLRAVLELEPSDRQTFGQQTLIDLGNALIRRGNAGDLDEAIVHFRKALERQPGDSVVHHNLGTALFLKGQIAEAISHYQSALKINPDDASTHRDLGHVLVQIGRVQEANAHFQRALEIQPDKAKAKDNLVKTLEISPEPRAKTNQTRP
jgi:Flp pilus assembly protein TadD